MKNIIFKNFEKEDFNTVCEFLIHMSKQTSQYMNWNWARWEWMYFHPDFKEQIENKIGLWYSSGKLIALSTFDFYEGESVFIVDPNYRELEDEL